MAVDEQRYAANFRVFTRSSLIRYSANIAADSFAHATGCIKQGLRESEVAAIVQSDFDRSSCAVVLERSYDSFYCMPSPNSAKTYAAYARSRQRVFCHADLAMIPANNYQTDISRTYTVGTPDARQRDIRVSIEEPRCAAIDVICPGVQASTVDRAARDAMTSHGFGEAFRHSTAQGFGFAATDANAQPRIHPQSSDVLEEGMTFSVESADYFDGYGGMRHSDALAVASCGASVITDF